jgi:ADP-ribose pyrophosphatase YjhB (NUDIX family)
VGAPEAEVRWQLPAAEEWRQCPVCGAALAWRHLDGRSRRACPRCGFVFWAFPWPSVAALVRGPDGRVLITRRRYPPEAGGYCLPGGHMEEGETPEAAVLREVEEETGVRGRVERLLEVLPTRRRTGLILFYAVAAEPGAPRPGSDALEAAYVRPEAIPPLCFETHQAVVERHLGTGPGARGTP